MNFFPSQENAAQHSPDSAADIYRWLLILGFPAGVAAAKAMPEIFLAD